MKIFIVGLSLFVTCCHQMNTTDTVPLSKLNDSTFAVDTSVSISFDPTTHIIVPIYKGDWDSLKKVNDSLTTKLFLANYKVEKVKYYLHIAIKNPSQTKFLKSWISRAVQ